LYSCGQLPTGVVTSTQGAQAPSVQQASVQATMQRQNWEPTFRECQWRWVVISTVWLRASDGWIQRVALPITTSCETEPAPHKWQSWCSPQQQNKSLFAPKDLPVLEIHVEQPRLNKNGWYSSSFSTGRSATTFLQRQLPIGNQNQLPAVPVPASFPAGEFSSCLQDSLTILKIVFKQTDKLHLLLDVYPCLEGTKSCLTWGIVYSTLTFRVFVLETPQWVSQGRLASSS